MPRTDSPEPTITKTTIKKGIGSPLRNIICILITPLLPLGNEVMRMRCRCSLIIYMAQKAEIIVRFSSLFLSTSRALVVV